MTKTNPTHIFTYGTLKKGFTNHFILENENFISAAITLHKYQMYPCTNFAFPFLIKSEEYDFIKGEVFEIVSSETLSKLDVLEGYPDLYLKEFIEVKLENGKVLKALTYFKNEETNKDIIEDTFPINEWTKDIASTELDDIDDFE